MVAALLSVAHGHCGFCQEPADDLFVLDLTHSEPATLRRIPQEVHLGLCEDCWRSIGHAILRFFRVAPQPIIYPSMSDTPLEAPTSNGT